MAVIIAYVLVVLIWATIPLTIQWSSHSFSFSAAVLLRMSLALALALIINAVIRRKLFTSPHDWRFYAAAALSVFPNMPVVYWAAQYIPSGLVAVIFAFSPFVTGLMMIVMLKQNPFTLRRIFALLIALVGLVIVFYHQIRLEKQAAFGVFGILLSCFFFGLSSLLVKKMQMKHPDLHMDAFNQMAGALLFSLPGLLLTWYFMDGAMPHTYSTKSVGAVLYLAVFGSLLGGTLFFYVLHRMSASLVSLIPMMTPLLALIVGLVVAGERLSNALLLGSGLVIGALLFYSEWSFQQIHEIFLQWFERKMRSPERRELMDVHVSIRSAQEKAARYK